MAETDPRTLVGRWELRRRVVDRVLGAHGTMVGELTVVPDGVGLRWDERGTLRWDGAEFPATRTYLLRENADGWAVEFADGRPFHPWRPGEAVTHLCRADLYTGLVHVGPTLMRTLWDVTGPTKHQRLITRFRRIS